MTRRGDKPQRPRHVPILDEDWEWLERAYGQLSASKMGPGPAIRGIVNIFVKSQKAKEQALLDARAPAMVALEKELNDEDIKA